MPSMLNAQNPLPSICVALLTLISSLSLVSNAKSQTQVQNVTEKVALGLPVELEDFRDQILYGRVQGVSGPNGFYVKITFNGLNPTVQNMGVVEFTYHFVDLDKSSLKLLARPNSGGLTLAVDLKQLQIVGNNGSIPVSGTLVSSAFGCWSISRAFDCPKPASTEMVSKYGDQLSADPEKFKGIVSSQSGKLHTIFPDVVKPMVLSKQKEEQQRAAEAARLAEEAQRAANSRRLTEEAQRAAEAARLAEETTRLAEETRRQEESRRRGATDDARRQEESRRRTASDEARRQEEARRQSANATEQSRRVTEKPLENETSRVAAAAAVQYLGDIADFTKTNRTLDPIVIADFFGRLSTVDQGKWTQEIEASFNELRQFAEKSVEFTTFREAAIQRRTEVQKKQISDLRNNLKRYEDGITGFIQGNLRSNQIQYATALVRELRAGVTSDVVDELASLDKKASEFIRAQSIKLAPPTTAQASPTSQGARDGVQQVARAAGSVNTNAELKIDQTIQRRETGDGFKNFEAKSGTAIYGFAVSLTLSQLPTTAPSVSLIGNPNSVIDIRADPERS
jgi:hypothetical protein